MLMFCSPDWHDGVAIGADYFLLIKSRPPFSQESIQSIACCADHVQQAIALLDIQPGEDATLRRAG
jgi:hypothetical protein